MKAFIEKCAAEGEGLPASVAADIKPGQDMFVVDNLEIEDVKVVLERLTAKRPSPLLLAMRKRKRCDVVADLTAGASKRLKQLEQDLLSSKFEEELVASSDALQTGLPTADLDSITGTIEKAKKVCAVLRQVKGGETSDVASTVKENLRQCFRLMQKSIYQKDPRLLS